ncbi:MAG TPA: hypothetical protein VE422_09540 [Terriglobia bacterium]|nr:hypothetical protein [Terriglobia bacterium]
MRIVRQSFNAFLPRSPWFWFALAAAIGLGVLLRSEHMTDVTSRSPDERIYTYYANRFIDEGLPGYRQLFADYNRDPALWVYPAPTRCGYVFLSAMVMKATGVRDARAGAAVSWLFSILSMFLLAWIAIRFFNPGVTLLAVTFLAFSFGELGMARRAWQDSTFGLLGLLLVYLTCEITRAPRQKVFYFAFFVAGTYCLLFKETAYLCYGGCGLWLAGVLAVRERSWRLMTALSIGGLISALATLGFWTVLAGDTGSAISSVSNLIRTTLVSDYANRYYSGPWYQFAYLLWITGPLTAAMGMLGITTAALSWLPAVKKRLTIHDCCAASVAVLITMIFFSLASFGPIFQNLRIVSPSDGTYCLLAGLGFWYLLSVATAVFPRYRAVALIALASLILAAVRDYRAFTTVVVRSGMEDLAVRGIRQVMYR